jgi:hypothetical protein
VNLIRLKQDSALLWVDVTTAMNARRPQVRGISQPAEKQLAYTEISRSQSVSQSVTQGYYFKSQHNTLVSTKAESSSSLQAVCLKFFRILCTHLRVVLLAIFLRVLDWYRLVVAADENMKTVGWLTLQSIVIVNITYG